MNENSGVGAGGGEVPTHSTPHPVRTWSNRTFEGTSLRSKGVKRLAKNERASQVITRLYTEKGIKGGDVTLGWGVVE